MKIKLSLYFIIQKLKLFHKETVCTKDDAAEESCGRTLKLFGTTLLVTDTSKPFSLRTEPFKPIPAAATYLMQLQNGCSDLAEGPASIVPRWTFSHNALSVPLRELKGKHLYSNVGDFEQKEVQKEGSWTGSNTSSINDGGDNTVPSETSAIFELRVRPKTCGKGFVPYKRCMAEREKNKYSSVCDEEREEQRIKLSL